MGYTFEIHYKQGKENVAADALSRVSGSQLLQLTLSQIHHGFYDKLKQLWDTDQNLHKIIIDLQDQPSKHSAYSFTNGELRRKGKLVVGDDPDVKLHIFKWLRFRHRWTFRQRLDITTYQDVVLLAKNELGNSELCSELFNMSAK